MKEKFNSVDAYFNQLKKYKEPLFKIRALLLAAEYAETLKWNIPVYTIERKNVVGLASFKNHFGIWFYQGVFLSDPDALLINAQENKTKALRQIQFTEASEIPYDKLKTYFLEAKENQLQGKMLTPTRKPLQIISPFMKAYFEEDPDLAKAFQKLSNSCKNEYIDYIKEAKKEATQERRMQKIIPMIKNQKGLNDAYKK